MGKILIIEDSIMFTELLTHTLESNGHEDLYFAKNGHDGVELAKQHQMQLILTDINMPKMDGYQLISAIRNLDNYKKTPIIVLSSESADHLKAKSKELGATAWVVKPYIPGQLIKAINICLGM